MFSVIIPASNEAAFLGACLQSVIEQSFTEPVQVVVAANACRDATVEIARSFSSRFQERGWTFTVLDIVEPGKTNAMNHGDAALSAPDTRVYLDADVECEASLFQELHRTLDRSEAAYASGNLTVAPARSWTTRCFARLWTRLPFVADGVPGAGLFAVNASGRGRWKEFPTTFSDDTYVRLLFTPEERFKVNAHYLWPMPEGLRNLVRVRRRQKAHYDDILRRYPELWSNMDRNARSASWLLAKSLLRMPISLCVYLLVTVCVRLKADRAATFRARTT